MELNWDVFPTELTEVHLFKSINTKRYVISCFDNHKAWEMPCVFFYLGMMDELLVLYVRHCREVGQDATASDYLHWKERNVTNPNYLYLYDQVFIYMHRPS